MTAPSRFLLLLTFVGFISLGLPDAISGVVWPSVASHFDVSLSKLGYILVSFTAGYLCSSLSITRLLPAFGVGGLLAVSCAVMVASLLGFAFAPGWGWYLVSAWGSGAGAGAIDTGLNAFAARHFSARHMAWLHGCWGLGATSGAAIAASVIATGWSWQRAYLAVAAILLPATLAFFRYRQLWTESSPSHASTAPTATMGEAIRHPLVWLQGFIFFIYVGTESSVGQWAYTLLTKERGSSAASAGTAVSLYWASLTCARFCIGAFADRVGVLRLVVSSVSVGLVGGMLFAFARAPWMSTAGLMILGASLATIYPGMMSQTPKRMGRLAEATIGFQVAMALVGVVVVPSFCGIWIEKVGLGSLGPLLAWFLLILWIAIITLFFGGAAVTLKLKSIAIAFALFCHAPGAAMAAWTEIPLSRLDVTSGRDRVRELASGLIEARAPVFRATVRATERQGTANAAAQLQFGYRGPTVEREPTGGGEERIQLGHKLLSMNPCNLVYVMWRLYPMESLVVSVKRHEGSTSAECRNRGYTNVVPDIFPPRSGSAAVAIPFSLSARGGKTRVLRSELDRASRILRVRIDGRVAWQGRLPAELIDDLEGPVGIRSDNGVFRFRFSSNR